VGKSFDETHSPATCKASFSRWYLELSLCFKVAERVVPLTLRLLSPANYFITPGDSPLNTLLIQFSRVGMKCMWLKLFRSCRVLCCFKWPENIISFTYFLISERVFVYPYLSV